MRPFKILGVQQIAIGGEDLNDLRHFWIDLLGATKHSSFESESENVIEDIVSFGDSPGVEIDLMQPLDPNSRPKVNTPPLNHVGFWVDDIRAAFEWLSKQGVRFTPGGIRQGASGHDVCFIHPKGATDAPIGGGGVLIELVQAPAEFNARPD